ncbi:MAG: hypothetical protein DRQ48_01915 [Gammaproteobacteria bacterium]|nr:MAG: hypothetical protein DRQ48_01915 [Gammaproteobacteria bacterium]
MNTFEIERAKQRVATKQNIEQAVETLFNELNCYGRQDEITDLLTNAIIKQHRTLQQDFWRVMFDTIKAYGVLDYHDGRNVASVKACKDITSNLEYDGHYLPRI